VRLYWGWQFTQTGWAKLHNIDKLVNFFTNLGIPAPALNAHFVAALEFGGGVLLILGLGSRLIALPLVVNMLVAYITADREALFSILSNPDKFTAAAPYTFLFASLIVLIFGPGKISADALLAGLLKEPDRAKYRPPVAHSGSALSAPRSPTFHEPS
jgi:putative oxidoreductase